ncbi:MAG: SHOCT domain-containing protein [Nitrosarchaeum sp.]|nr:SHOCT domain-containing protein [Nitrosarchaeum sp.]MBP0133778.1 SHOCT domain-containing protein [Nitrosarchaeum sp.]MDW7641634.1 SHOCT domain-containing protein [Nitrosarchaeum sp.]
MVDQKPVSVEWQIVFCIVPYFWIFAFYRIEKLTMGIILGIASVGIGIAIQIWSPIPYGFVLAILLSTGVAIYFIIIWSRDWNAKISNLPSAKSPLVLLQERYAKGEITKDEFDTIKSDLKD